LQDPADLVAKLEHDLDRIRANSHGAYAAFDFFTADHVGRARIGEARGRALTHTGALRASL
jgi:hypothetical protein